MVADDDAALEALLATDPYAEHDLIDEREILAWNPLFGAFQGTSSLPVALQSAPLGALLGALGGGATR